MHESERFLIRFENGLEMQVETSTQSGGRDLSSAVVEVPFEKVRDVLSTIATGFQDCFHKVAAEKIKVQFGIELSAGTSGLLAMLCQGSSKTNLAITLEWGNGTKEEK